jgi:8-oxo-dGTP diphosphatase
MKKTLQKGIDFTGVTIVYFCHDGKGNFVMSKRGKNSRDEQGRWDIGGGGLEFGDTVENTIRKEIKEEYCTEVISYEFLGYRDVHRMRDGKKDHWVALDFKVLIDPKKVKNGEPHKFDDVQLFRFETMPNPVHSQFPKFLELYKRKLKNT